MPLRSSVVGTSTAPVKAWVDARWSMAYAAALNDMNPRYFKTQVPLSLHPMFPVCVEWPVVLASRALTSSATLLPAERGRSLHATQDLHILKPVHPDVDLTTTATLLGVEQRKPGVYQVLQLDTCDPQGDLCFRTYHGTLWSGVTLMEGEVDRWLSKVPDVQSPVPASNTLVHPLTFDAPLAHVYSECARIWNPIHTDHQAAYAAGLPNIILHGTATLALTVSKIVELEAGGDPSRLKRIAGRFRAMVEMPAVGCSFLQLKYQREQRRIGFVLLNNKGEPAIEQGLIELH